MKVLLIDPIRYCTFPSGPWPSTEVREPSQTTSPPRSTAATTDGARPVLWATAIRCLSARRVAGSSSRSSASSSMIGCYVLAMSTKRE